MRARTRSGFYDRPNAGGNLNAERIFNPIGGFDYSVLDDPGFGEDAVREEIIAPILHALAYSVSTAHKIVRSRRLSHPFVSVGTTRRKVTLIPDYLLFAFDRPAWVLEAKSPHEDLLAPSHLEQAYSYAIHPEIRVPFFALCNGRRFTLYNVSRTTPEFDFPIEMIGRYWPDLSQLLNPVKVLTSPSIQLSKDLGLHLQRLGCDRFERLIFPNVLVTHFGRISETTFTFSTSCLLDGAKYIVTFDFGPSLLPELAGLIPIEVYDLLSAEWKGEGIQIQFAHFNLTLNISCHIGDRLEENDREIFCPLIVDSFLRELSG